MRASDLIGLDVYDSADRRVGVVTDLRCRQDVH
jgi:sporulation protein YlmC with PRC-barrel domain